MQEVCLWDLRKILNNSMNVCESTLKLPRLANAFAAHKYAPVTATGSVKQFVDIYSTVRNDTKKLNDISFHDGFLKARIGPVTHLEFHKYKLLLAVAGKDRFVSLYSSPRS